MTRALSAGAVSLALLVTACGLGDQSITEPSIYRPNPSSYLLSGGMVSRAIPTYVVGNPFGISQESLANVVGAALESAFPGRDLRFAVREEEGLRDDVAMVVAFDPPAGTSPKQLCRSPGRLASAPSGQEITAVMTFCQGTDALAGIRGRLDREAGLGDKEFVVLIRDMARRMFEDRAGQFNA